jgi:hypothetical protein
MATYYFDFDNGDDNNTAPYSPTNALQNLPGTADVTPGSNADFSPQPGDILNLARGSTWEITDRWYWTASEAGTLSSPITIQAHDRDGETGQPKPIVSLFAVLQNIAGAWQYWDADGGNIWYKVLPGSPSRVLRCFFDFVGQNSSATGTGQLGASSPWYFSDTNNRLFIWTGSAVNTPDDLYSDVRCTYTATNRGQYPLQLQNTSHLTFDGIEFRGGDGRGSIYIANQQLGVDSGDITIKNCNIYYSALIGVKFNVSVNQNYIGSNIIESNDIDAKWSINENIGDSASIFHNGMNGIDIEGGFSNNLVVRYNRVIGFGHTGIQVNANDASPPVEGVEIYENYISCPTQEYGRAAGINGAVSGDNRAINCKFYKNLCHDTWTRSQFGGTGTLIYQNVFSKIQDAGIRTFDVGQAMNLTARSVVAQENNIVANNVIIDPTNVGIDTRSDTGFDFNGVEIRNNIIIKSAGEADDLCFSKRDNGGTYSDFSVTNNKFYSPDTSTIISWSGTTYTVAAADSAIAQMSNNLATNEVFNDGVLDAADFADTPISCSMWFSEFYIESTSDSKEAGFDWWGLTPPSECSGAAWSDASIDLGLNEQVYSDGAIDVSVDIQNLSIVNYGVTVTYNGLVTFVGSDAGNNATGADISLTLPSHQTDDFGLMFCGANNAQSGVWSVTVATGWTQLAQIIESPANERRTAVFYKKFTSGSETDPTASFSAVEQVGASVHVFRNVDTADPWGSASPFYSVIHGLDDSAPPNASITTDTDNSAIVVFHAGSTDEITAGGAPTGYTLSQASLGRHRNNITAYLLNSGLSGVKSPGDWTNSSTANTSDYSCYTIALKPQVTNDINVSSGVDNLALTEYNTTVKVDNGIQPNSKALTLTSYNVDIDVGLITALTQLTLTTYDPLVEFPLVVSAGSDSLTLTEYNTDVAFDIPVTATRQFMSLDTYNPEVFVGNEIAPGFEALSLTAYNVTVDGILYEARTGATDSDREMEQFYYAQWEALRLAIYKYYGIDDNNIN